MVLEQSIWKGAFPQFYNNMILFYYVIYLYNGMVLKKRNRKTRLTNIFTSNSLTSKKTNSYILRLI